MFTFKVMKGIFQNYTITRLSYSLEINIADTKIQTDVFAYTRAILS